MLSTSCNTKSGFTLIELSIVLVIIGLIIGGILTGQDLIRSAEQRATLAQIEKYNTAVNTFRTKYSALPGDMNYLSASGFGLAPVMSSPCCMDGAGDPNPAGSYGYGDDNGVIVDVIGGAGAYGEPLAFWAHLSKANLIDGTYGLDINNGGLSTGTKPDTDIPAAKIGRGNYVIAGSAGSINYFSVTGISSWQPTNASGAISTIGTTTNMTPIEVYNMDKKIDDGKPFTGTVLAPLTSGNESIIAAFQTNGTNWQSSATTKYCTYGGANSKDVSQVYNISTSTGGNTTACAMIIRAAF